VLGDAIKPTLPGRGVPPPQENAPDTWRGLLNYQHRFGDVVANTVFPGEAFVKRVLLEEEILRVLDIPENRTLGMTEHDIKQLTQSSIPGKIMYAAIYFLTNWKDFERGHKGRVAKGEKPLGIIDLALLPSSLEAGEKGRVVEGTDHMHDSSIGHVSKSFKIEEVLVVKPSLNQFESDVSIGVGSDFKTTRTTLTTIAEDAEEQSDEDEPEDDDSVYSTPFDVFGKGMHHETHGLDQRVEGEPDNKAVKADDAEVNFHLWNDPIAAKLQGSYDRTGRGHLYNLCTIDQRAELDGLVSLLRRWALKYWKQKVRRNFRDWFRKQNLSVEKGKEVPSAEMRAVTKADQCFWWEWDKGSAIFFW